MVPFSSANLLGFRPGGLTKLHARVLKPRSGVPYDAYLETSVRIRLQHFHEFFPWCREQGLGR
jgi:hypothetical protein